MKFYMPTRLYVEEECVLSHNKELSSLGQKALIVTGKSSAIKSGAFDDVTKALNTNNVAYCVFNEVEENPSTDTIIKATTYGLAENVDFVIGIGGGSPLDAAKAIAFMLNLKSTDPKDLYNPTLPSNALPIAAIPTTCGTGSEVTGVSVLTVHDKQTKSSIPQRIFPQLALVDGKYLMNAPHSMIVNTSIDALAHMVESLLSKKNDQFSQSNALTGITLWSYTKKVLTKEKPLDSANAFQLMLSSTFGGLAIAQTGTSIPHALSYILTYDQHIPHGKACGYFLGKFLREAPFDLQYPTLCAAGFTKIEDFQSFLQTVFGDFSVPSETLERAYNVVVKNKERLNGCRFDVDEETLRRIVF